MSERDDTDPPFDEPRGLPPAERGEEVTFLLRVRLHCEPLTGSIQLVAEKEPMTFQGWISFMSAINALLDGSRRKSS